MNTPKIKTKRELIKFWKDNGLNDFNDYVKTNRDINTRQDVIDTLHPNNINYGVFWRASVDHFGHDCVANRFMKDKTQIKYFHQMVEVLRASKSNMKYIVILMPFDFKGQMYGQITENMGESKVFELFNDLNLKIAAKTELSDYKDVKSLLLQV